MSSVVIAGNTSGTVTLDAPDIAGSTVLTLPATSGQVLTQNPSAPADSFVVNASGNVGVGTSSPSGKLDVNGQVVFAVGDDRGIAQNRNGVTSLILWKESSATDELNLYNPNGTNLKFGTNNTERMRITGSGEVFIAGTTDRGAFNLQCNGTGVWGAGAYTNGSDARIKDDITPLDSGLDVVEKLNPVTYKYKQDWSKDQSIQTGFIAQDLLVALEGKEYVDGIVNQSSEYMSVAYQNIIPILTKAIQELKAELDTVKAELTVLKGAA